ncbi:MAG: type 4a pilus biogenesis protein PilO [Acidobacteria bacterium]|nr:type 4a pilus biogenesis protein PilO [Acidobacteriota bacterium]
MTNSSEMTNQATETLKPKPALPWWRRIERRHMLIVLGVLLAFDAAFYIFAVRPLGARAQEQQILVRTLRDQRQQKRQQMEGLRAVSEKVEKARLEGDELVEQLTLARKHTFSRLVKELNAAADEAGLESRERNYGSDPIEGADEYGAITVTASFHGGYEQLVKLLNRLDRSEEFLIIGSLGATPRSETNDLQITMKIDTFVRGL